MTNDKDKSDPKNEVGKDETKKAHDLKLSQEKALKTDKDVERLKAKEFTSTSSYQGASNSDLVADKSSILIAENQKNSEENASPEETIDDSDLVASNSEQSSLIDDTSKSLNENISDSVTNQYETSEQVEGNAKTPQLTRIGKGGGVTTPEGATVHFSSEYNVGSQVGNENTASNSSVNTLKESPNQVPPLNQTIAPEALVSATEQLTDKAKTSGYTQPLSKEIPQITAVQSPEQTQQKVPEPQHQEIPFSAVITLNEITLDNTINNAEASALVQITGTVGGDVKDNDLVTLTIGNQVFNGVVVNGIFQIAVSGSSLLNEDKVIAELTVNNAEGHSLTVSTAQHYLVDTSIFAKDDQSTAVEEQGALATSGNVLSNDDQDSTHVTTTDFVGRYGVYHFETDGSYTYELDNTKVQSFRAGEHHEDFAYYEIKDNAGNTTTAKLTTLIEGTNDRGIILGTSTASLTEDKDVHSGVTSHELRVDGALTVTDLDNGQAQFSAESLQGQFGTLSINNLGHWTYTADNAQASIQSLKTGESLTDTVLVHSVDGTQQKVTVTINGTDDKAVIGGTSTAQLTEDKDVHSGLLRVDGALTVTDLDNGQAQFSAESLQGQFGTLSINNLGHWTYTADNSQPAIQGLKTGESVTDTVLVHSVDGTEQKVTVTINGTDDKAVIAGTSTAQLIEDKDVRQGQLHADGQLTVTDFDAGENQFTANALQGQFGTLSINSNGHWTYTADNNQASIQGLKTGEYLTDTVLVHSVDGTEQKVTVTINGTDDKAVITGQDTGNVTEDIHANVSNTLKGFKPIHQGISTHGHLIISDPDAGEAHFVGQQTAQAHGTFILSESGSWNYTVDNSSRAVQSIGAGQSITDTIAVTSADGTTHEIVVTIQGTNDTPKVSAEVILLTGTEDTDIVLTQAQLLVNSSDVDSNDKLHIDSVTADHGAITINADGSFTFHPDQDYNGQVHFTYDVKDAHGGVTHTGASTTLAAINDNPDVLPITDSVKEDASNHHTVDLLLGASDKEGDTLSINQLSYSIDGSHNSAQLPPGISIDADGHTVIVDATNAAYNHLANGQSQTITITYQVNDGQGGHTQQTADLTIEGTDDKATLVSNVIQLTETQALDSKYHTYKGNLQLIDPDSGDNTQFTFSGKYLGLGYEPGHFDVWPDGSYQFRLQSATNRHADDLISSLHAGESMEIPYEVKTNDGQKITIMVKVIGEDNQARIEVGRYSSFDNHAYEDNISPGSTPNQIYSGGNLKVIDPDHSQAGFIAQHVTTSEGGSFFINPRGNWAYTIDNDKLQHLGSGESYQKTFTVDSIDGSAHQNITVTVHGTNDVPVVSAQVQIAQGTEDTDIQLSSAALLANATDVDDNDAGMLTIGNLVADHGTISDNNNGTYTFHPEQDYNGQVHFTYDVKDAHGGLTHTGATTTLTAVRDSAVITEVNTGSITEDGTHSSHNAGTVTELATGRLSVVDPDSGENSFQYSQFGETKIHDPYNGFLRIDNGGNWTYRVDNARLQYLAEGQTEVVTYQVHSRDGTPYELRINIIGTNDVPTVSHVVLSNGTEDVNYQMQPSQFGFNDVDSGDTLHSIAITNLPSAAEGKFVLDGHDVSVNQVIDAGDISKLQFVPAKDSNGDVSFKFTVNDGHGDSIEATNVLHIDSTNDASIITGDSSGTVSEGNIGDTVTATGQLSITDVDTGDNPSFIDVASTATTYGHIVMANGQWTYTLDENKVQQLDPDQPAVKDHYTFKASDGSIQTVDISIKGTNDKAIIESAHAAPVGTSSTLKLQDVDVISNPTGANIDVAPSNAENAQRWGADQVGVGSGVKLVGLYKPGSDHNWITNPATTSTAHSGAGGFSRIDNHDWWHANGIPDTVNTGSGGATGHGNAWTGGIAVFEDSTGHQTIAIVNRVCTGGGSEVDYLYYHSYQHLQVGNTVYSGTATASETIHVMDGNHQIASVIADTNGHWEISASNLADGKHTLHVETSAGEHSAETILQVSGHTVQNITPAALNAEIKEDAAQTTINGELRTSDVDTGDTASFTVQADHATKYGHFSIDSNGHYHFTIDNNNADVNHLGVHQTLTEVIPVTSTSTDGTSVTTNVTITIQGSLDKPILNATAPDAQQGTTIALNLNVGVTDTGGDHEDLLIKISGLPDTATLNHGTHDTVAKMWVLHKSDLTGLELNLHNANFHGNLHFNATATASAGSESQSATQAISLFVNAPPSVTSAVTGSKAEDSGMGAIDLLSGATDADTGDTLSVGHIEYQIGTSTKTSAIPSFLTLAKDGHTLIIDSNAQAFQHLAVGESETVNLTYNIMDSHGGVVQQTATLNVTGTNDAAHISGQMNTDERTQVTEGTRLSNGHMLSSDLMTLSINDLDSNENYFIPTGASGQTNAKSNGSWVDGDKHVGQFILHASGQWLFRADNNNSKINSLGAGEKITDTITVHSADGTTQQLTSTIYGTNDQPTITVAALSGIEDTDYQFSVGDFGFTDVDTSDTLDHITITSLANASEGVLLLNGVAVTANQEINNADINLLTFKPAANFNGDVHFSYIVNDGHIDSAPATSILTIANVNDLPTVVETTSSTDEDTDITITKAQLLAGATDIDNSDALDINSVSVNGGHGTVIDNGNGTWTLHPDSNFKGDITLAYKVNDGHVDVDNHMTVSVSTVTDTATTGLSLTAEQQVMKFSPSSGGGLTNNGHLQTGGDIENLAVEFNIIGGPTAPPAGHNGPTFISYGTSHSENEFYVWNPTNLTIRVDGTEYKTGISATDGLTHRYSVLWSSSTGHLEVLVDGESKWVHSGPVAQGYKIPGNGILAVGNDQDSYNLESGGHANHGFSTADAFHGEIFSASLANAPVTAAQLKSAPLASIIDKDNGLVIDIRANAAGQFVDATGHHQLTATTDVQSQLTLVDTSVAIPNADALIHLNPTVTPPTDTSDVITKVELTGLLKGTVVDDGHGHQHTITSMTDLVNIKDWNIATLTAQLPGGNTHNMNIGLIVTTQGPDGAIATDSHYQSLVLDPNQPIPDAVITGDKQLSTDEVTSVSGQLTITDTDVSQAHFIAEVIPSAHGDFSVKADGSWEFTPSKVAETLTQGHNATDIITVKTVDGTEQQLSVTLVGSDTAPTAVTADLGESISGSIRIIQVADLLAQVTDVDTLAANLSVVAGSLTSPHGSFSLNTDGSYSFTPTAGFSGQDLAIQYKVTDGTTQIDANAVIDSYLPLSITHIGHDTGSSSTDFITSDGHLTIHGTGHPGDIVHGLGIVLNGLDATVDANGQWSIDSSATDRADNTYSLVVYVAKPDGSFPQAKHSVTIDTAKPTISIDSISKNDWVDHNEHNQSLLITGDTTHVADGDLVHLTIAGQQYTASVQHNHWQLSIPAVEVAHISDNAYLVHAEVSATATGDSTHSDRHIVVSADLSTLIQSESTEEDTKSSAAGDLFATNSFNTVTNTGLIQGNFGSLRINADGSYQYELNNAQQNIQQMAEGDKYSDNFFVSYTNPNGDVKHAVLNVGIHGTNDSPTMTGTFEISRAVTNGYHTNTHSFGYININDADQGDTLTVEYIDHDGVSHTLDLNNRATDKIDVKGIGNFNIESNGKWDFTLSHSGPERAQMEKDIAAGHIHTESITIKVTDSHGASREETLTVHIGDGNTGPQIFGASESVVTEDSISSSHGLLDLLVGDVKVASGVTWALQPGSTTQYGDLTFKPDGSWEYQSHNSDPRVQALAEGERLEENILITATDSNGHSVDQTMKLVIIGTNDVPTIGHQNTSTVIEDNLLILTKAQLLANVKDIDGLDTLSIENIHMDGKGTITAEGDHWVVRPNLNFDGNLRLEYNVNDGHVSVANSMAVNVTPDADTPTLIFTKHVGDLSAPLDSMSIAGNENSDLALNINVASPDSSETLTVEISGLPTGSSLSAGTEHNGIWTIDQADLTNLKLTPSHDFSGDFNIQVQATSHDGSDTNSVSQQIGVHVIADLLPVSPAPDVISASPLSVMSDSPQADMAPVDYYLNMVGISNDDVAMQDSPSSSGDHLAAYVGGDTSIDADPLVDDMQSNAFENPLDDEHKSHDIQHEQTLLDSDSDTSHLENLAPDDDDSLHQALNDMHSQF